MENPIESVLADDRTAVLTVLSDLFGFAEEPDDADAHEMSPPRSWSCGWHESAGKPQKANHNSKIAEEGGVGRRR